MGIFVLARRIAEFETYLSYPSRPVPPSYVPIVEDGLEFFRSCHWKMQIYPFRVIGKVPSLVLTFH
jgi:hypothetical protein